MKIKELITKWQEEQKKCLELATKTATNTEKYYWEVKELKNSIVKLVEINKEISESVLALLKQQLGD